LLKSLRLRPSQSILHRRVHIHAILRRACVFRAD
jgi:hypothetical protein